MVLSCCVTMQHPNLTSTNRIEVKAACRNDAKDMWKTSMHFALYWLVSEGFKRVIVAGADYTGCGYPDSLSHLRKFVENRRDIEFLSLMPDSPANEFMQPM